MIDIVSHSEVDVECSYGSRLLDVGPLSLRKYEFKRCLERWGEFMSATHAKPNFDVRY